MRLQNTEVAVRARDLSIAYSSRRSGAPRLAVQGVDFDIERDEILGLIGESGSGKSTLAAVVAGLQEGGTYGDGVPEIRGGSLAVFGQRMRGIRRRPLGRLTLRIGYLSQNGVRRLNPHLTVAENIAEPIFARDRHFNPREAGRAVAALLDAMRLHLAVMSKFPHELSSGQVQRVALARALILDPWLLVADEPVRGVDVEARAAIFSLIAELQRQRDFSALIVSSDLDAVDSVADRIAVLYQGSIVGIGTVDEMLRDPHHPYLKGLARSRAENT